MQSIKVGACVGAALALAGCAAALEQSAAKGLEAKCAEMGLQFVKTESRRTEAVVVSSASVTGECVGPTDPRWVSPEDTAGD